MCPFPLFPKRKQRKMIIQQKQCIRNRELERKFRALGGANQNVSATKSNALCVHPQNPHGKWKMKMKR